MGGLLGRLCVRRPSLRSQSLLTRVAAASAAGTSIIVGVIGTIVWSDVEAGAYRELDARLEGVTATAANLLDGDIFNLSENISEGYVGTYWTDMVAVEAGARLPRLDEGFATIDYQGQTYRVLTKPAANILGLPVTVSVATPVRDTEEAIHRTQRNTILVSLLAVGSSGVLGAAFAALATRPLRQLAAQTRRITSGSDATPPHVKGVVEAEELAGAIGEMLARIRDEQRRTEQALETARDFAAVSAHELRTPLTAMRTNLEVLASLDLPAAEQREILTDVLRAQDRVESTLYALERLAAGELTTPTDHSPVDLGDLLDVAAQDAARTHQGVAVTLGTADPVTITGLATGLRLAVDNAVLNAVRHGGASAVELSVRLDPDDGAVELRVDDNGTGVPEAERERVFEKFARGADTRASGSGLGLALVAQQAALHGGCAAMGVSHLGGARLVLRIPADRVVAG